MGKKRKSNTLQRISPQGPLTCSCNCGPTGPGTREVPPRLVADPVSFWKRGSTEKRTDLTGHAPWVDAVLRQLESMASRPETCGLLFEIGFFLFAFLLRTIPEYFRALGTPTKAVCVSGRGSSPGVSAPE